jgi:hypothetical protein
MDLYQEPAAIALLANHAHPIRVLLLTLFRRRDLRALRQKPPHRSGGRESTTVPRPGVPGSPLRVAVKKGPQFVGAVKKRFLGRDHHDIGIRREQLDDAVGIARCEPGAEALEDLEQRPFRLRIRPHDQAILAALRNEFLEE